VERGMEYVLSGKARSDAARFVSPVWHAAASIAGVAFLAFSVYYVFFGGLRKDKSPAATVGKVVWIGIAVWVFLMSVLFLVRPGRHSQIASPLLSDVRRGAKRANVGAKLRRLVVSPFGS